MLPDLLGEDQVIFMIGLHIETLKLIGKWLEGNGSVDAVRAEVASPWRAESYLCGSHVKQAWYAHQVSVAPLYILLNVAWKNYVTDWVLATRKK